MTYVDDDTLGQVRKTPLYEERYPLLTPQHTKPAELPVATWAQVAELPLCLLSPGMRNRRIMNGYFTDAETTCSGHGTW